MAGRMYFTRAVQRWLAPLIVLATPLAAGATPACGGSTFTTCASVTVIKVLLANGNVRVRIEVMNQAGLAGTDAATRFTYIGLWGLPSSAAYVDSSLTSGGTALQSDWRVATPTEDDERQGLKLREDMRGVRLRPGVVDGIRAGQVAAFEFDLSGVTFDEVNVRDWEIHAELAGAECATDLVAKNGTLNEARKAVAQCAVSAVTPEPPVIFLVATGLAVLSGLSWRRRRLSSMGRYP